MGNEKCNSGVISTKVYFSLANFSAIHKNSCYGYYEEMRHF